MLARLAYLIHMGLVFASVALAAGAASEGRVDLAARALAAMLMAAALRWLLQQGGCLESCEESLDLSFEDDAEQLFEARKRDPQLEALLVKRARLEKKRGSPEFDPWELLAVQHDIAEHLRTRASSRHRAPEKPGAPPPNPPPS